MTAKYKEHNEKGKPSTPTVPSSTITTTFTSTITTTFTCTYCGQPCTARGHYGAAVSTHIPQCSYCGERDVFYHYHFSRAGYCLHRPGDFLENDF